MAGNFAADDAGKYAGHVWQRTIATMPAAHKSKVALQRINSKTAGATLPNGAALRAILAGFLDEDLGAAGDVTSNAMIAAGRVATALVVARTDGVLAGAPLVKALANIVNPSLRVRGFLRDGDRFHKGQQLFRIHGSLRGILLLERTLLNILGRLCGVATLTNAFASRVKATKAKVRDTRKTTPGLRALEKYAVCCGGGVSHRAGLFDAFLAKDNHVEGLNPHDMAMQIQSAAHTARRKHKLKFVMVEVDNLRQLAALLRFSAAEVDAILLDNMSLPMLRKAVALRDQMAPRVQLEASGGVTLRTVTAIAKTGVDFVSVGAITHSAPQIDLALDMQSKISKRTRR